MKENNPEPITVLVYAARYFILANQNLSGYSLALDAGLPTTP